MLALVAAGITGLPRPSTIPTHFYCLSAPAMDTRRGSTREECGGEKQLCLMARYWKKKKDNRKIRKYIDSLSLFPSDTHDGVWDHSWHDLGWSKESVPLVGRDHYVCRLGPSHWLLLPVHKTTHFFTSVVDGQSPDSWPQLLMASPSSWPQLRMASPSSWPKLRMASLSSWTQLLMTSPQLLASAADGQSWLLAAVVDGLCQLLTSVAFGQKSSSWSQLPMVKVALWLDH